jgi:hypothetical protein
MQSFYTGNIADDGLRGAADQMCASRGIAPDQRMTRKAAGDFSGLAPQTLAKKAAMDEGPPYRLVFGRAQYEARSVAMWLLQQSLDPAEGPQKRAAQTRRDRGDRLGRPAAASAQSEVLVAAAA